MSKFSLKETKVELEQLFNSNEEEKYLALGTEFMRVSFRQKSNHPDIINIIVNFFNILKDNHNNFEKYFTIALGYIGILAYYNHHFNLSINCNYLALVSRNVPSATFYHNIALSMEALDLYHKAKDYYEKSIETLEQANPADKYNANLKVHYQLNYVSSLINLNEIAKAQNLIKTIDKNIRADEYKNFEYGIKVETIRLKLITHPEYSKWEHDVRKIKELILKMDMPSEILNINNTILKLPIQLEEKYLSKLLKQNYKVSKKLKNPNIQRKAIYDLIEFYVISNNKKKRNFYVKKLLKLQKLKNNKHIGELKNLFLKAINIHTAYLNERNKQIINEKTEFEQITYLLSHDLKTPLRTIASFTNLIERDLSKQNSENLNEYLGYIKEASSNLYRLTEEVASLHKVKKNSLALKPIPAKQIAQKAIINLKALIYEKEATVHVSLNEVVIRGEEEYLMVVFQNLIENGLKYNQSKDPEIKITGEIKDNKCNIYFKDNGIGIDPAYHQQIFSFFKRLHSKSEYSGTGFGLGICKKIMNKFNGEITVDSKLGEGATFTLVFPVGLN